MRIRTIKPEFWSNEKLSDVSEPSHMFAAALLNYCDDEGYFNANPKLIKASLYPIREPSVTIHGMLIELSNMGYLRIGSGEDGRTYGHIIHFCDHQKINRPSTSKIKHLADFSEQSVNSQCAITKRSLSEQGTGNREQGKEQVSTPKPPRGRINYPDKFQNLWLLYPPRGGSRDGKKDAFGQYKVALTKVDHETIEQSLMLFRETKKAKDGYPPDMDRWLKSEPWDNDVGLEVQNPQTQTMEQHGEEWLALAED